MAEFAPARAYIAPLEGGYVNNSRDKGGPTNFGITESTARAHGYAGDMRDLTYEQAGEIYAKTYWPGLESLQSQAVATKIFDMRVNMGVGAANKLAQRAANTLVDPPTAIDGLWGPDTVESINAADPAEMLNALADQATAYYQSIIERNPDQEVFARGWFRRALQLPPLSAIAGGAGVLLLFVLGAVLIGAGRK